MRIFSDVKEFRKKCASVKKGTALAIGKFDGIHLGHQKLLDIVKSYKNKGLATVVFTFDIPMAAFFSGHEVQVLTTNEERREYLAELGIDYLIEFPVNDETINTEPEDFVKDILVRRLNAKIIAAGYDCSFGRGGRGNIELLRSMQKKYGFETVEVEKISYADEIISSTLVRGFVADGNMEMAEKLLGHPYSVGGKVSHGRKLGSAALAMPTVNIMPASDKLLPPFGVYFSNVIVGSSIYHGITNIGRKPTISDHEAVGVETFIYDFDDDLYGEKLRVDLLHWHREEMKFPGIDALKIQMHKDMNMGKDYFSLT